MKTIKELADVLEVSKTAIRKHMTEAFRAEHTATNRNGVITIDSDGCALIAESMGKLRKLLATQVSEEPEIPETHDFREEVAFLREQLRAANRQIEAKDRQIEQLTAALDNTAKALQSAQNSLQAAQALHAGTMQQQLDAGEQPDRECQDETAIDAEVEYLTPDEPQAAPEQKAGFAERFRRALKVLKGE